MTGDYVGPDPEIADFVARSNAECDRARERLNGANVTELKRVFRDQTESNAVRAEALLGLLSARDPELDDLLLGLFDDPDQQLWQTAFSCYRSRDPRILKRLNDLLDDSDDDKWSTAAVALACIGNEALIPRLADWLHTGDEGHRNVAIESLKMLRKPAATAVLSAFWDQGLGDEEARWVVAAALFDLGDSRGRSTLESLARRAEGSWSVFAATNIYCNDPREGLKLMMHLLQNGDLDAKQSMVNQIWNFARLPHAFTADGLAEAELWVRKQLDGELVDRFAFPS